jgi:hypothetical protein
MVWKMLPMLLPCLAGPGLACVRPGNNVAELINRLTNHHQTPPPPPNSTTTTTTTAAAPENTTAIVTEPTGIWLWH